MLSNSYKWYNALLEGYCQKSICSIQHLTMADALSHVGLSMLALQPKLSKLSCTSFFYISSSLHLLVLFCPIFSLFVIFLSCHIFLKYLDSKVTISRVFISLLFCHSLIFLLFFPILYHYFICLSYFITFFEFSVN
jgi:hypothetical protein